LEEEDDDDKDEDEEDTIGDPSAISRAGLADISEDTPLLTSSTRTISRSRSRSRRRRNSVGSHGNASVTQGDHKTSSHEG
jgi:proton-coupled amino acid transporter